MDFDNESAILCDIYQGANMGSEAIHSLLPKVSNPRFRSDLKTQHEQYQALQNQAEGQLKELGKCPEEISFQAKAGLRLSIQLNTLANKETSHLAQMMISGSTMGITDITKALNHYTSGDQQVRALAESMIQIEQDNIERMKLYLS